MNVKFANGAKKAGRLSWFATDNGRRFSLGCVVTFGLGSAALNLFPHTLLLDQYKDLFQMYRKSTPVRVSPELKKQFNDILGDLNVPEETRSRLRPFTVNGFDVFHAGTTHLISGAVVGVPNNFNSEETENIKKSSLVIQNKDIDWNEPDGQNLLLALTLSENAKKFAIGREVIRCQTIEPISNSLIPLGVTAMTYSIARSANTMICGFSRPLALRLVLYTLTGLFGFGVWACVKDLDAIYLDTFCDKELCELGKDYVKGGQEFYSKILQRNLALRNLMGKQGEQLYTASGNEKISIRRKGLPTMHRKLYFDERMKDKSSTEKQQGLEL